jgi:hypothetical protein
MTRPLRFPLRLAIAAAALLFTLPATLPALAQTTPDAEAPPVWKQTIGTQLALHLRSADVERRQHAMQVLIGLADRQDPTLNLLPAAPALLDVYRTAEMPAHRLMAVSAISLLDDEAVQSALAREALLEPEARVRWAVLHSARGSKWIGRPGLAASYNALLERDAEAAARTRTVAARRAAR